MSMSSADVDAQVAKIGSLLRSRVPELAQRVAQSIRSDVEFYKNIHVIPDDELLAAAKNNLSFVFAGLAVGVPFDTSPAVATGSKRAAAGVPLPSVMDAFRVAAHQLWEVMIELASEDPGISREALLVATSRFWHAQDLYTAAMAGAYRQQAMHQALEDEAERAALAEALLEGRLSGDYTLWEVAQLLRIPLQGPYLVVAAATPSTGKQALPGIASMLPSIQVFSAWRLLPDLQIGIAHIPFATAHDNLLKLLERMATTRVGVSPPFDDLADTAQALRYARIALGARAKRGGNVTVFEDSVLGVAAVSAPEVTTKLVRVILSTFEELSIEERDVLFDTFGAWLDNSGSVAKAANQLFCHPNTVRYRLHRIEERTGRSLAEPRELAELCLAFEIYQQTPER